MLWFVAKRCILMVAMLLGLLVITFSISHIAPGDPAALAAGPDASKEMIELIRKEYGLDKSLPEQFYIYLKALLSGNWGKSIHTTHEVWDDLVEYFPATVELVIFSIFITVIFGVPVSYTHLRAHET